MVVKMATPADTTTRVDVGLISGRVLVSVGYRSGVDPTSCDSCDRASHWDRETLCWNIQTNFQYNFSNAKFGKIYDINIVLFWVLQSKVRIGSMVPLVPNGDKQSLNQCRHRHIYADTLLHLVNRKQVLLYNGLSGSRCYNRLHGPR